MPANSRWDLIQGLKGSLIILTTVTLASSNSALPDDSD
jgi:hypothetical protein